MMRSDRNSNANSGKNSAEENKIRDELLPAFPAGLSALLLPYLALPDLAEIRLRAGLPLQVLTAGEEYFLREISGEELRAVFGRISQYSAFAHREELTEGYLTLPGGHRAGVCGKMRADAEGGRQFAEITSLNIRVARQVPGCCHAFFPALTKEGRFLSTLIVAPPGAGKTTYLRDIIRCVSDGYGGIPGENVSVVDERSEIGNRCRAGAGFYLGKRTDLLDGCPKSVGMLLVLRAMGPHVIAADEIGAVPDVEALRTIRNCGCRLLMTAHGWGMEDVKKRPVLGDYLAEEPFARYVAIRKGRDGTRHIRVSDGQGRLLFPAGTGCVS